MAENLLRIRKDVHLRQYDAQCMGKFLPTKTRSVKDSKTLGKNSQTLLPEVGTKVKGERVFVKGSARERASSRR